MATLLHLFRALRYGAELRDAEIWKTRAAAIAALNGLLSALAGLAVARGWIRDIDPETLAEVAAAIVTLVSTILAYLQVATSERVGLGKKAAQEVPMDGNFLLGAEATPTLQAGTPDGLLPAAAGQLRHPARDPGPATVPARPAAAAQSGDRQDDNPFLFS